MNNLALFVTHSVFLTKDQIDYLAQGFSLDAIGHCVPVWVDAKTGGTTEPASEIFCNYTIHNSHRRKSGDIEVVPKKGYEIFLPTAEDWSPPEPVDFDKISSLPSSERELLMKERDKWWFSNPRPPDIEDLVRGYLRFEVKKIKQKINRKEYSAQHVIEIGNIKRLEDSLTS